MFPPEIRGGGQTYISNEGLIGNKALAQNGHRCLGSVLLNFDTSSCKITLGKPLFILLSIIALIKLLLKSVPIVV